ncbi:hypothetical protein BJV82DRAFT_638577 [Fennellomyces sp. T-0311]|nr:hypothetical protein BJV82DRAFT_638577 [Fennellomyces sp. T-0311]
MTIIQEIMFVQTTVEVHNQAEAVVASDEVGDNTSSAESTAGDTSRPLAYEDIDPDTQRFVGDAVSPDQFSTKVC